MESVNLANVNVFIAAFIAAMLVYFFSSLAIRAVGTTAQAIIVEVRRQFREMPGIMDYTQRPDYARVVDITTSAALREMVLPGLVAVATPIVVGVLLGYEAVAGFLMVGTITGVLLATVLNNGGGAWDNAKKYIESGHLKDDAGNVLGQEDRCPRGGRRRRHGRRSVQGHRRPVAPRPGQAARDDHARPRPALHPLGARSASGRSTAAPPRQEPRTCRSSVQALRHGDRPGPHRVPADLELRAPDHRPVPLRLERPVHHLARVQRDAPHGHAASRCSSTSGATGCVLVPAGFAAIRDRSFGDDPDRRLAWLIVVGDDPGRSSPAPILERHPRGRTCARPGSCAITLVVGAAHPLAGRPLGRQGPRRRPAELRPGRGHRRRPGVRARPGHQPLGDQHLGRPARRPRPASRPPGSAS